MISDERRKELLFPHDEVRPEQNKLLLLTDASIKNARNLIAHAPTGLGKTAATLSPALAAAKKHDYTVLFLTSRHTQHKIAMDTLLHIKKEFGEPTVGVSFIGKKWMCLQPGVENLYSSEFSDFCRKLREEKKCQFYTNARQNANKFTFEARSLLKKIELYAPLTSEQVKDHSEDAIMCPYEISLGMAQRAKVIIADYYYLFHPNISDNFLAKIDKELDDLIVIVDEAHNLPYRLKDLASEYLSTVVIKRAIRECKKYGFDVDVLEHMLEIVEGIGKGLSVEKEKTMTRDDFFAPLEKEYGYQHIIEDFHSTADHIREQQKTSYTGSIATFLETWIGDDEGFVRIIAHKKGMREPYFTISYRCLDPAVISKDIINNTRSTILMSGTLLPTQMYRELLGVEDVQEVVFKDPFPKNNRLNMIVPQTTTKYQARSKEQFKDIARVLAEAVDAIPGNVAIFFPSYFVMDKVKYHFETNTIKTVFTEDSAMNKSQRQQFLEDFKGYKEIGAVLLGVASGSFGEGIDLPGDLLRAVIMVGLPLGRPDLETKSLIDYFDKKFKRGWDYGYLYPAFNKTLQNAGRCIRSETDRGIIMFLDERYAWSNYRRCFPEDWDMVVSNNYKQLIKEFFRE